MIAQTRGRRRREFLLEVAARGLYRGDSAAQGHQDSRQGRAEYASAPSGTPPSSTPYASLHGDHRA